MVRPAKTARDHVDEESRIRAHLEAYMAAFLGTEQESIREFEEAGQESWVNADRADKR